MPDEILDLMNDGSKKKMKTEECNELDKIVKLMCKKAKIAWRDMKCKDIEQL